MADLDNFHLTPGATASDDTAVESKHFIHEFIEEDIAAGAGLPA